MPAKTTTIATIAATGVLAFGAGVALSAGGQADASGNRPAASTEAGHGAGMGQGHGAGKGQGHGAGKGKGHGAGKGAGKGQGQGQGRAAGMGYGKGRGAGEGPGRAATAAKPELTPAQRADLRYMREEEKLAHDVYTVLARQYPDAPFAQIAMSEQRHASAVQRQLDRAGMADPTQGNAVGQFENADLQKLYDTLVDRGSASRIEALEVGALIEETDIADLRKGAGITKDAMIKRVYSNLERASGQHLRIFASELRAAGVTYAPTVLSQAGYDQVLAASMR